MWCISLGVFFLPPFRFQFNYSRKRHFVSFIISLISGHPRLVTCKFNSRLLLNRRCNFMSTLIVKYLHNTNPYRQLCPNFWGPKILDLKDALRYYRNCNLKSVWSHVTKTAQWYWIKYIERVLHVYPLIQYL